MRSIKQIIPDLLTLHNGLLGIGQFHCRTLPERFAIVPPDFVVEAGACHAIAMRRRVLPAILGGTELSLILRDETVFGVRILDTTQIHVEAAVARLIRDGARS